MNRAKKTTMTQRSSNQPELVTRTSTVRANSARDEDRSIEAVLATEAPVTVFDLQRGFIQEVLLMDGCVLPRNCQLTLIDSHQRGSVQNVLGSTRELRIENGELIGRNYYADDQLGRDTYSKTKDGHITDNSVGYRVLAGTMVTRGKSATVAGRSFQAPQDLNLRVTTKWMPKENSACVIGADENCKTRSDNQQHTTETELNAMLTERQKEHLKKKGFDDLDQLTERQISALLVDFSERSGSQGDDDSNGQAADDAYKTAQRVRDEGAKAELQRQETIRKMAGDHIPAEMVNKAITERMSIDSTRELFYQHMVNERSVEDIPGAPAIHVRNSELSTKTLEAGLLLRAGGFDDMVVKDYGEQTAERADHNYRDVNLMDICRYALHLEGQSVPISKQDLIRSAMSTISLPQILGNVAHKALLKGYRATPDTWQKWCSTGTVSDFKEHKRVRLVDLGELESLLPSGEFAHGSLGEEYETIKAETKGKTLGIGRKEFINDDIGVLTKVPQGMGVKSKAALSKMIYTHFLGNPTMSDGNSLFDSTHSNLNTTTPLAAAGLNTALKAFAAQTDKDGESIDIMPKFLIVPPDIAHTAKALLQSDLLIATGVGSSAATTPSANIHKGILELIVESRLSNAKYTGYSAADWYLAADPNTCDTVEVAFLNGRTEPYLERYSNSPGFLGVIWQIYFDAGVKAMDWRGLQKNDAA
ncbi:MAG: Mu-like prophage major head subunit gpT family protein [Sedimentisphaerales bacterium]|nr:Mu-like prophage major head subunit gpT family protein [Sedimentisphaerales bacterium]